MCCTVAGCNKHFNINRVISHSQYCSIMPGAMGKKFGKTLMCYQTSIVSWVHAACGTRDTFPDIRLSHVCCVETSHKYTVHMWHAHDHVLRVFTTGIVPPSLVNCLRPCQCNYSGPWKPDRPHCFCLDYKTVCINVICMVPVRFDLTKELHI